MSIDMLTKKQKELSDYIKRYIDKNGYSPTIEEMARHFKKAVGTIHEHLETLREKGVLEKLDNQPRAIQLLDTNNKEMIEIPLVGTIAAGQPIEAVEAGSETVAVLKDEIDDMSKYYALRVTGDSMINEGIFDGDIVLIRQQKTAENGQTVVAIIDDNEATLKKIYKEKTKFRLQPANQTLLPFFRKEVEIRGVVTKIIRNLDNKIEINNFKNLDAETLKFVEKKNKFLNSIKSNNPDSVNKYKRVVVSPLRYAGGKSLGVGFIVELLPDNIKRLVSPFFGGGSVEIACNKYLDLPIIGCDIFDILVNYWQIQIKNPKALYKKLLKFKPNESTYKKIKDKLKAQWKKKIKLPPFNLASYYYFNHNLSYGPGFLGWPSKIYLNKERYKTTIEKVRDFSVKNIKIECSSFEKAFTEYPNDFFYCDPPYLLGEDTKMFRGIYPMRNIPVHHNGFEHEKLRDLLKKHKGGFVLSYNNCKTIRDWYSEYKQYFPKWQYTMGQGETRIGLNRKNGNHNHVKESHEIIIFCPPTFVGRSRLRSA